MPRDDLRPTSIRGVYEERGAERYYRESGKDYRNPHEAIIGRSLELAVDRWKLELGQVLDLAAGSGEVTLVLRALGATVAGIDPFTADAYEMRTGQSAERFTFADIAAGALNGRRYSLIVCSFALHLCEPSRLPAVAGQLSQIAPCMLILTPHKRPILRPDWGWTLYDEMTVERVRTRFYQSTFASF